MAFVTSLIMTSRDQFLMTSDQFEIGDDQNWSQKPPGPEKTRHGQDRWTLWSRELSETCILYMINGQNEKNHFAITLALSGTVPTIRSFYCKTFSELGQMDNFFQNQNCKSLYRNSSLNVTWGISNSPLS